MARTDTPNVARLEEKDSPSTRKTWDKKKAGSNTVWPCTIDGCDKQFAREADLKRHQRTTKTHSMPSFACPQCHATFTRTDAQRRHQKSRHNGVVIEGSPSASPTSSTSASTDAQQQKGKCREDSSPPVPPPNSGGSSGQSSSTAGSSGSGKYYREDTGGFAPTYSLYPATTGRHPGWRPVHWPSSNPHYTPSPYYRSSTSYTRGPTLPPLICSADSDSSFSESPGSTPISPTVPPHPANYSRVPVDPLIARSEAVQHGATPEEMEVALKAVMRYVEVDSATHRTGSGSQRHGGHGRESNDSSDEREQSLPLEDIIHHYDSPAHRPGSLQDILTEDCEPIFHSSSICRDS